MGWTNDSTAIKVQAESPGIGVAAAPDRVFVDDLLGPKEMAKHLKMSTQGFYNAVKRGQLPGPVDFGKGPRWSKTLMATYVWTKFVEQTNAVQKNPTTNV